MVRSYESRPQSRDHNSVRARFDKSMLGVMEFLVKEDGVEVDTLDKEHMTGTSTPAPPCPIQSSL